MSYPVMATTTEDTQTSGTDLEEINTEDEMADPWFPGGFGCSGSWNNMHSA